MTWNENEKMKQAERRSFCVFLLLLFSCLCMSQISFLTHADGSLLFNRNAKGKFSLFFSFWISVKQFIQMLSFHNIFFIFVIVSIYANTWTENKATRIRKERTKKRSEKPQLNGNVDVMNVCKIQNHFFIFFLLWIFSKGKYKTTK